MSALNTVPEYADFDDYRYTQRVVVAVRWFILVTWLAAIHWRSTFSILSSPSMDGPLPRCALASGTLSMPATAMSAMVACMVFECFMIISSADQYWYQMRRL